MTRSLKALAAISVFSALTACSSTGEYDELAGETDADIALDGKADGAVNGAYTYFEIWRDMSDEQRAAARQRYQEFRRLPPDQRARLIDTYRRYRMMPPERRMELRQRFRELTPEQRQTLRERRLRQPLPR